MCGGGGDNNGLILHLVIILVIWFSIMAVCNSNERRTTVRVVRRRWPTIDRYIFYVSDHNSTEDFIGFSLHMYALFLLKASFSLPCQMEHSILIECLETLNTLEVWKHFFSFLLFSWYATQNLKYWVKWGFRLKRNKTKKKHKAQMFSNCMRVVLHTSATFTARLYKRHITPVTS